ncbi:Calx-beta domain-containing protein [Flavobacterium sp. NRK1]|uniref:Calx-beta domain-containing protein n=1 Tax=Flavobacterium sp. NRK1 TaxID=2954929 RepID=UPI002092A386|nr:Calx-beta domain-containing protein [Flavobacterium sp. NRK1]MCO6148317.1 hypothetical protein [Flavobacterium sp. NRK1]
MKRYILKLALFAFCAGTLMSCDEDTVTYGGTNFVSFDKVGDIQYPFFENRGVSEIPVNLAFPKSSDVTVTFTITSDVAVEGVDYNVLTPGSFTIPAGETTGYIKIDVVDNDVMDDSKILNITLTGTSDSSVSLGLADEGSKYKNFLIVNDDCTTNFLEFVGKYSVVNGDNDVIGTAEATVNETGECNILWISGVIEDVLENPTDTYIQFTLVPGANPATSENVGTLSAYQQLYCEKCYTDENSTQQNILFTGGGQYNLNVTPKRLAITGNLFFQSSVSPIASSNVRLIPVE